MSISEMLDFWMDPDRYECESSILSKARDFISLWGLLVAGPTYEHLVS